MAAPDPYPTPPPGMPPVAEAAPPMGYADSAMPEDEAPEEEAAEGKGEVLKNHLYLPGDFPGEKEPKPGDKKAFMADGTFVEIKDGEQCWKVDSVDGVPLSADGEEKTEQMGEENESTTSEASAPSEEEAPADNAFTAIIMGKKRK